MLADLERLVRLQQLDDAVAEALKGIDSLPSRTEALVARIDSKSELMDAARSRMDGVKHSRQELEKEVAQVQARLTRFKEQIMEVKTTEQLHAVQSEIRTAEAEVQRFEDKILQSMLEIDELNEKVQIAEQAVKTEQDAVSIEQEKLENEQNALRETVEQHAEERKTLVETISTNTMTLFETLSRSRKGIAIAKATNGRCSVCQVAVRPQLYNEVRQNATLQQCESCQRILYFPLETSLAAESQ